MKRLFLIIILTAIGIFSLTPPEAPELTETSEVVQVTNEDPKAIEKPTKTPESEEKVITWRDNPQNCEDTSRISAEPPFDCLPPVKQEAVVTSPSTGTYTGSCDQFRSMVSQYDWNVNVAMAIMQAESGCRTDAANTTDRHRDYYGNLICVGSYGLFQISCHSGKVYDPTQNIAIAYQKYVARGWQPWGAYTNGAYLKYLR